MRKPDRKPTAGELVALVVALVVGFGVAIYFGNLIWAIAVVIVVAIAGFGFFFAAGSDGGGGAARCAVARPTASNVASRNEPSG